MTPGYKAISWNPQKKRFIVKVMVSGAIFLAAYLGATQYLRPGFDLQLLVLRATALLGFLSLHFVLLIGPLSRFERRFMPFVYHRRHIGVLTFLVLCVHGVLATWRYFGEAGKNPLVLLLSSNAKDFNFTLLEYRNLPHFPFEPLGFAALLLLGILAATSHDFWQRQFSRATWKLLHMLIYPAYALALAHVMFGILQDERDPTLFYLLCTGAGSVILTHVLAYAKEARRDLRRPKPTADGFVDVCHVKNLAPGDAISVNVGKERVAVCRLGDRVYAVADSCPHQGAPLGEGRVLHGCLTCPWHGRRFHPADGEPAGHDCAPVPTHAVRIERGIIYASIKPSAPGTRQPGAHVRIEDIEADEEDHDSPDQEEQAP